MGRSSPINDQALTVVVAEDEELLREIAAEFLKEAGFNVIEALHAQEAIEILDVQFEDVQILFTDIQMPGDMDGLALAHHVKNHWPQIGLLITSGNRRPAAKDLPEGAKFLMKPYRHADVIKHVMSLKTA